MSQHHHLSQQDVISGFQSNSEYVIQRITSSIAQKLVAKGISPDVVFDACQVNDTSICNMFSGLETNYLQEKYYMEHFAYVVR